MVKLLDEMSPETGEPLACDGEIARRRGSDAPRASSDSQPLMLSASWEAARGAFVAPGGQLALLYPLSSSQVLHRLPLRSPADGARHRGDGERRRGEGCGLHPVSPVQLLHHRYQSLQHSVCVCACACVCVCQPLCN